MGLWNERLTADVAIIGGGVIGCSVAYALAREGLLAEPKPFVLQRALGDFAVTYEINVYCGDAQAMEQLYTRLYRNILDVFNDYGVQIMTPAYVQDPAQLKVVPKEQWYAAPAIAPARDQR